MNYGIKKVLKEKNVKDKKIVMAELFGTNLFAIFKTTQIHLCR